MTALVILVLIAETYKSKSFLRTVVLINCVSTKRVFIKCRFDQVLFPANVVRSSVVLPCQASIQTNYANILILTALTNQLLFDTQSIAVSLTKTSNFLWPCFFMLIYQKRTTSCSILFFY